MSTDKVIITCALTGVLANRDQCPWVPYTPVEIAEEARRAFEAGAAVVHIHARTDEGGPTYEPSVYAAIRREIERRCPVILNFSTGGAGPMEGRVAHIAQVRPTIGALNMGSMNYAKYSSKRMARSNGELVEKAVRMARDIGREPATVEEARRMLTLEAPW